MDDFEKCSRYEYSKGIHYYYCRLFLWDAGSSNKATAKREALSYWQQYASDGEYSSIIGGESVIEKLRK